MTLTSKVLKGACQMLAQLSFIVDVDHQRDVHDKIGGTKAEAVAAEVTDKFTEPDDITFYRSNNSHYHFLRLRVAAAPRHMI